MKKQLTFSLIRDELAQAKTKKKEKTSIKDVFLMTVDSDRNYTFINKE